MVVDQKVVKVTDGTAFTTSHNNLHQINDVKKNEQNDNLIVIDPESSESSSSDESVEVVSHYKLDDIRPVIGNYGKYFGSCKI